MVDSTPPGGGGGGVLRGKGEEGEVGNSERESKYDSIHHSLYLLKKEKTILKIL